MSAVEIFPNEDNSKSAMTLEEVVKLMKDDLLTCRRTNLYLEGNPMANIAHWMLKDMLLDSLDDLIFNGLRLKAAAKLLQQLLCKLQPTGTVTLFDNKWSYSDSEDVIPFEELEKLHQETLSTLKGWIEFTSICLGATGDFKQYQRVSKLFHGDLNIIAVVLGAKTMGFYELAEQLNLSSEVEEAVGNELPYFRQSLLDSKALLRSYKEASSTEAKKDEFELEAERERKYLSDKVVWGPRRPQHKF